jgi:hypothetical protein
MRLAEFALYVAPFLLFAVWRLAAARGIPSSAALALAAGALLVMMGVLVLISRNRALPPGSEYVPAQLQSGRIIPGHGAR